MCYPNFSSRISGERIKSCQTPSYYYKVLKLPPPMCYPDHSGQLSGEPIKLPNTINVAIQITVFIASETPLKQGNYCPVKDNFSSAVIKP